MNLSENNKLQKYSRRKEKKRENRKKERKKERKKSHSVLNELV